MTEPRAPRTDLVKRVNFGWYLLAIVPIAALIYAGIVAWLPSWVVLIGLFAFFFWLFSLIFAGYAVLKRRNRRTPQ